MITEENELEIADPQKAFPWWQRLATVHDRIFSNGSKTALKHAVIRFSIAGFALHLSLIFLARTLPHPPALLINIGTNYLRAISTPFNFILFYEVVTLIGALHESMTRSIAYQFQIVSLIFIRDVFKDIADAADMVTKHRVTWEALPLFADMWGGFLMFLMVAIFHHVAEQSVGHDLAHNPSPAMFRFTAQKKAVALGLGALLIAMAAYNLGMIGWEVLQVAQTGQAAVHPTTYYNDLFTVMIFTDVLILILSLVVSDHYESVFRSAAFVVSIVLIRFSLTEGFPYGPPLALLAMIFGILTLVVFNYYTRVAKVQRSHQAGVR